MYTPYYLSVTSGSLSASISARLWLSPLSLYHCQLMVTLFYWSTLFVLVIWFQLFSWSFDKAETVNTTLTFYHIHTYQRIQQLQSNVVIHSCFSQPFRPHLNSKNCNYNNKIIINRLYETLLLCYASGYGKCSSYF